MTTELSDTPPFDSSNSDSDAVAWAAAEQGVEHEFQRSPNGTLLSEERDDLGVTWQSWPLAGGTLGSVDDVATGASSVLAWDSFGQAHQVGDDSITWSADGYAEEFLAALDDSGTSALVERRITDAYGRLVRVFRDGASVDIAWSGDHRIEELADCGYRTWWNTGIIDQPFAFSMVVGSTCTDAELELLNVGGETNPPFDVEMFVAPLYDVRGDVVGTLDESSELLEAFEYDVHGRRLRLVPDDVTGGANAAVSLGRGDLLGFGLSMAAIVPGLGQAATGAKLAARGAAKYDYVAAKVPPFVHAAADSHPELLVRMVEQTLVRDPRAGRRFGDVFAP